MYSNYELNMAKKEDSFFDKVLLAAGLIGGAWITAELIKAASKKKEFYKCPNCNASVVWHENPCHNCKAHLIWPDQKKQQEEHATS